MTRYFLALINFVTLMVGIALSSAGIYGLSVVNEAASQVISLWIPTMILLLGLAVSLVSLLGMYTAFNESSTSYRVYFGVLLALLLIQVLVSSMALARQGDVDLMLYDAWDRAYDRDPQALVRLEKSYGCCGFASLHDRAVPKDCADNGAFGFVIPCRDRLGRPIKRAMSTLGITGLVLAGLLVNYCY